MLGTAAYEKQWPWADGRNVMKSALIFIVENVNKNGGRVR